MKVYNIRCFVQFGRNFDIDVEANSKKDALKNLKKTIDNIGYQYCRGDEMLIDVDDCDEVENDRRNNLHLRKQFRNLQAQYAKVVEQNRALQAELREKTAECGELKIKLMQAAGWYKTSDGQYRNKM